MRRKAHQPVAMNPGSLFYKGKEAERWRFYICPSCSNVVSVATDRIPAERFVRQCSGIRTQWVAPAD